MISTKSSQKRIGKVSSDSAVLSFDLLSNLTYMAALATGGTSRDTILEWTIRQNYKTGAYFHQVYLLSKRLGFEYARSFRLVARKAKAPSVKNLLLRFAGAISSGVSEADFLADEARVEREQYINGYYRSLESLTKWGDAYAALLVSVSLVVVVAMMSTLMSNLGTTFVLVLSGGMLFVCAFGVYIIYRTAPYEVRTYQNRAGPPERRWAKRLLITILPIGLVLSGYAGYTHGIPYLMLCLGFALAPAGIMAWMDNNKVNKRDLEAAPFIRTLGNVTASLGTTLGVSLSKIDRRSLGSLDPSIRRLQVRLRRHISTEKSWDAFRDEVGSELMNRTTHMFVDGVSLGGPPERVGAIAAEYAMDSAMMRGRRIVSAAPFAFLVVPLHFAMTALMVFVLEIMKSFNTRISQASEHLQSQSGASAMSMLPSLPIFQPHDTSILAYMTLAALIALTVSNTLAPRFALGGHAMTTAFFGAIICTMTGLNMLLIPPIASRLMLSGSG